MAKIGPKEAQRRALRAMSFRVGDRITGVIQGTITAVAPKRGRPALKLTPQQRVERKRQQARKRVQKHRAKRKK